MKNRRVGTELDIEIRSERTTKSIPSVREKVSGLHPVPWGVGQRYSNGES